jgi:hypothetical protein
MKRAREALRPGTIIEGSRAAQYAARNALAPILVQPQGTASTFLQAIVDEAKRRAVVAGRARKIGGAANALTGGMAPYAIRREVEDRWEAKYRGHSRRPWAPEAVAKIAGDG